MDDPVSEEFNKVSPTKPVTPELTESVKETMLSDRNQLDDYLNGFDNEPLEIESKNPLLRLTNIDQINLIKNVDLDNSFDPVHKDSVSFELPDSNQQGMDTAAISEISVESEKDDYFAMDEDNVKKPDSKKKI